MSKFAAALHVGRTFGMRGGMLRLGYELQRGSGLLSWKMKSVQGWDSWDLKRIAPGVTAEEMRAARRDGTRTFFFSNPQTLAPALKNIVGVEGGKAILAQAESILAGDVPFFGQLSLRLRISAAMVPKSYHRTKSFAATVVDADAFCLARLR